MRLLWRIRFISYSRSKSSPIFDSSSTDTLRHCGPSSDIPEQLRVIGFDSLDSFINAAIPPRILSTKPLHIPDSPVTESQLLSTLKQLMEGNMKTKSLIGLGYAGAITPSVIQRHLFEHPGWYTSYTPYQPEISQGRLESLFNFQSMVTSLTALDVANASLLDEATAAAEAMGMAHNATKRKTLFVDRKTLPQTVECLLCRAQGFGIAVVVGDADINSVEPLKDDLIGVVAQYPATDGSVTDYSSLAKYLSTNSSLLILGTDLLALTVLVPPGELGADIAFGSSQRFGVPLGYGGPHAAFFACRDWLKRKLPGRVVGLSKDRLGAPVYRLALQTREQHIRRERATSNICTSQVLLANMAAMFAIWHGPSGLLKIAQRVNRITSVVAGCVIRAGYTIENTHWFDTLTVKGPADKLVGAALQKNINLRRVDDNTVGITIDETVSKQDLLNLCSVFEGDILEDISEGIQKVNPTDSSLNTPLLDGVVDSLLNTTESTPPQHLDSFLGHVSIPSQLIRKSSFLNHPIFNTLHSETKLLRYIHHLQSKDLSLIHSMIPLGSCTMKLNAASQMIPLSWTQLNSIHPFVPQDQASGYTKLLSQLSEDLVAITGLDAVSLQPNSGAQGEYAGLKVIKAYLLSINQSHRDVCLIPVSAHGTNPASAIMAGLKVVPINCDLCGNLDIQDLSTKTLKYKDTLAAIMVTYPSTFGVFEPNIKNVCKIVHETGGLVYMDGANMNAQIGLCSPGDLGADVCHLNLHKTLCIPHGGGGPGMGPIAVKKHLEPFLPGHPIVKTGGEKAIKPVAAAPFGSASILAIPWAYIKAMEAIDVAKRLQDYGFHAPTMSWPVPGTLMIEPTESESRDEIDRYCDALSSIRTEIAKIEKGIWPRDVNPLKMAPHPLADVICDTWDRPYSREMAAYPLPYLKQKKFWPSTARVDDSYGDLNFVCSCQVDYID